MSFETRHMLQLHSVRVYFAAPEIPVHSLSRVYLSTNRASRLSVVQQQIFELSFVNDIFRVRSKLYMFFDIFFFPIRIISTRETSSIPH